MGTAAVPTAAATRPAAVVHAVAAAGGVVKHCFRCCRACGEVGWVEIRSEGLGSVRRGQVTGVDVDDWRPQNRCLRYEVAV